MGAATAAGGGGTAAVVVAGAAGILMRSLWCCIPTRQATTKSRGDEGRRAMFCERVRERNGAVRRATISSRTHTRSWSDDEKASWRRCCIAMLATAQDIKRVTTGNKCLR